MKKTTAGKAKSTRAPRKKKEETRVLLFPTEPTSIPKKRIDAAIDAVIARRKSGR